MARDGSHLHQHSGIIDISENVGIRSFYRARKKINGKDCFNIVLPFDVLAESEGLAPLHQTKSIRSVKRKEIALATMKANFSNSPAKHQISFFFEEGEFCPRWVGKNCPAKQKI